MAPPRPTITPHVGVPKVSFRKISPTGKEYDGVDDKIAQHYGYNEVEVAFERPEHYIRYVEPMESELFTLVEYDMDEQDDEWLNAINAERYHDQDERVSSETFEIIIDRLEKEWFDLMKRIPKPDQALPSEDSTCAVCDDGEGENSNAIVFCDGCNLAVHQDCYGVPYIPEGQWLCRKCTVAPESRVECILCPNEGGAFKQTSTGKWAHLLCAIWVPECILGNPTFMEPIENSDKIPKQRWKLVCSICKVKQGACIQCNKNTCVTAFHVSCARRQKLLSPMKSHGEGELQAFCEKHLPAEMRVNRIVPPSPLPPTAPTSPVRSPKKAARVQVQQTGPPLVPAIIVENIMQYTARIKFRKKLPFLLAVCKYWSLKREARRGAPLLKRLHLEPWATSTASKLQTDEAKLKYLDNLNRLRTDLEQVRTAVDLIRQREEQKQLQAQATESLLAAYLLPFDTEIRKAYDAVLNLDRHAHFLNPVSRTEVPDYYTSVAKPMHWLAIYAKIEQHEYTDTQAFVDDVNLVLDNAIGYNKKDTVYHKAAVRIKNNVQPVLAQFQTTVRERIALWKTYEHWEEKGQVEEAPNDAVPAGIQVSQGAEPDLANIQRAENSTTDDAVLQPPDGDITLGALPNDPTSLPADEEIVPETPDQELANKPELLVDKPGSPDSVEGAVPAATTVPAIPPPPPVGDLEPFPPVLRMLQDQASVSEDIPYILSTDPFTSFFAYDRPILKPPPPPAPPPPPRQPRKNKKKATAAEGSARAVPFSTRTTRGTAARTDSTSPQHPHPQRVVLLVRDPAQTQPNDGSAQPPPETDPEPASASTPTARGGVKRKRQDSEGWGQVVEDITHHDSFKYFESGWVLPAGMTRVRRPTNPLAQTSARKSSKEPKRVRKSASATVSRQSSQMPPVEQAGPSESTIPTDTPLAPPLKDLVPGTLPPEPIPAGQSRQLPQTLRLKVTRSRPKKKRGGDSSSDLSELSEVDEAKVDALVEAIPPTELAPPPEPASPPESAPLPEPASLAEPTPLAKSPTPHEPSGIHRDAEGEPIYYEPGTLVWAKQAGFPWYPAAIAEPMDERAPVKVMTLGEHLREKSQGKERLYLAQFYDKHRTWTWATLGKLSMLGEDPEIDQKYLHQSGKGVNKKDLRLAYEKAMQDMETPEEAEQIASNSLV
ncbi:nuA3 HAT complex component nto1 [Ceratobasidium sp. 394]|nr:nuA3 HAT complex component nto1 [Ceratobasidium sp. 394]KAG9098307.1 nuA3 HAT complex component nto1 [Ceratobasidium sp. UAMH 11750]